MPKNVTKPRTKKPRQQTRLDPAIKYLLFTLGHADTFTPLHGRKQWKAGIGMKVKALLNRLDREGR